MCDRGCRRCCKLWLVCAVSGAAIDGNREALLQGLVTMRLLWTGSTLDGNREALRKSRSRNGTLMRPSIVSGARPGCWFNSLPDTV